MLSDLAEDPYGIAFSDMGRSTSPEPQAARRGGEGRRPLRRADPRTSRDHYPLTASPTVINRKPARRWSEGARVPALCVTARPGEVERDGKFLPLIDSVLKAQREKIE